MQHSCAHVTGTAVQDNIVAKDHVSSSSLEHDREVVPGTSRAELLL